MDPLTTLLAAAAATGPNTLQSQALTALRSAGPQESFFTRMGNPHPLQLQQLAQPVTPQLSPIIAQPTSAPTALSQQPAMPILPLASPLADPAPSALHIPTLQAIQRRQQQTNPAAAMMPMMPQTPTTQPQAALPRDPTEYNQVNFPLLTPSRPSRDQAFILRSRSQLGKLPVPDLQLDEEWMTKWSYRAPPTHHTGSREGFSQSSQPQLEAGAPSVSYMDLTQEAATAPQQPPSRFRPCQAGRDATPR